MSVNEMIEIDSVNEIIDSVNEIIESINNYRREIEYTRNRLHETETLLKSFQQIELGLFTNFCALRAKLGKLLWGSTSKKNLNKCIDDKNKYECKCICDEKLDEYFKHKEKEKV